MIKTTIYLEQEVHDNLMSLADQRTSFSEHIRRALDRYLIDMGGFYDGTNAPSDSENADGVKQETTQ